MSIDLEFSRFATSYADYNIIQEKVVQQLLTHLKYEPKKILDLGCGRGAILEKINWEFDFFLGVDFAKHMLELHPKGKNIFCIYGNFDNKALFEDLYLYDFDYILSASAFQWSTDILSLFKNISQLHFKDFIFTIFTANTFKTLHKTAGISSPLQDANMIIDTALEVFPQVNYYIQNYTLDFQNTLEIFRYIKRSGVSGSRNILSYKEMKQLLQKYPLSYLEFEVVFLYT